MDAVKPSPCADTGRWIEKALAHEDGRSSRAVYNKAEYAEQRRHMLQEWANMIDAWVEGGYVHADAVTPQHVGENTQIPTP